MQTRAYELREGVDPDLFGGSVTTPDGKSFDIGAALKEGNGVIVTNDDFLKAAFAAYEPLKSTTVPENVDPIALEVSTGDVETDQPSDRRAEYNATKKEDLVKDAEERGLTLPAGIIKEQIIDALLVNDQEGTR
jgi:hypothetical protein